MDDLVTRWLETWTLARGLDLTHVDGWPRVHVGSVTRETEIVAESPSPEALRSLALGIAGDPGAMLTVIAPDTRAYRDVELPAGVRVDRDDECLMTRQLCAQTVPPVDDCFVPRWHSGRRGLTYSLVHEGRIASSGLLGVHDGIAVWDAVETTRRYQRQGLGRHVMLQLTRRALAEGATTGMLAASAEGRRLYEHLGWSVARDMWSLMGTEG